jgi:hypothetical protein
MEESGKSRKKSNIIFDILTRLKNEIVGKKKGSDRDRSGYIDIRKE